MPSGNPLAYGTGVHPYSSNNSLSLADLLSQALSGPATMSPEAIQEMQRQMALREYDEMMKRQSAPNPFAPPASPQAQGQSSWNPFEVLSGVLKQPGR